MAAYSLIALVLVVLGLVIGRSLINKPCRPTGTRKIPGPKGLPWIGRVHDIPSEKTWMKFAEWSDRYGPIYQHNMMGIRHIWVSKEQMVLDILAKQGSICSDRPAAFPNVPGTKDWKYLPLQGFHDTWRRQRKFTHLIFGTAHENNYYGHQTLEVPRTLVRFLQNPEGWSTHLDQHQARFLSRCAFGTPSHASALCTNAWRLLINISPSGRFSNILPGCMKVPKCIAWWRIDEQDRQEKETRLYQNCQDEVREQWEKGKAPPCFTRTYLDHGHRFGFPTDIEAAFNVGMVSMAGIHTTSSPLHTFFLAMTVHPDWMARLQTDIDVLCGDRMPVLSDMPALPIMRAIVKEALRWRPAVPTGIPHELQDDCVYDGYFLPKGSWVHPMEWSLSRDPEVYPDPETFNPDRWLSPGYPTYKEPLTQFPTLHGYHQFGFGRRICQGVNIVQTQTFCLLAAVAWGFDIKRKKDRLGQELPIPLADYHPLLITKPNPFQIDLVPRSETKRQQILEAFVGTQEKDQLLQKGI